jgi:hypothetical protein
MIGWNGSGSCCVACFVSVACSSFNENVRGNTALNSDPFFFWFMFTVNTGKPQLFIEFSSLGFIGIGSLHKESTLSNISQNCDCSNAKHVSTVQQIIHKTVCCVVSVLAKRHSTTVAGVQSGTSKLFSKIGFPLSLSFRECSILIHSSPTQCNLRKWWRP